MLALKNSEVAGTGPEANPTIVTSLVRIANYIIFFTLKNALFYYNADIVCAYIFLNSEVEGLGSEAKYE
jgi:hypothetical protein